MTVTVKDPDGRPTAMPFLSLDTEGSPASTRLGLEGGKCTNRGLPPGVHFLTTWSSRHAPYFARLEVRSG